MTLRFDQPAWLWIAGAAIPLAWIALRAFGGMSPGRRWSAIALRTVLFALIAALLAGLSASRPNDSLAVVAVVDTSASVRRFWRPPGQDLAQPAPATVTEYLRRAAGRRGNEDLLGVVTFDDRAAAAALPSLAPAPETITDAGGPGTNIAAAIRLARAVVPAGTPARLLLFSDGNQTAGDALAAAVEASPGSPPTPIDVVPLRYRLDPEVVLETLDAPASAPAESVVTVRVALRATAAGSGVLTLFMNGGPAAPARVVALRPGLNVVPIEIKLAPGRLHRFRATFEPDVGEGGAALADTAADNNSGESFTITPGRGSVLVVTEAAASTLAATLAEAGAEAVTAVPAGFPPDLLALEAFDLVVLDNVAAGELPPGAEARLATYVTDLGGGLVMTGGLNSFAPGGWRGSTLEPLLPVLLDVPDRVIASRAATLFVIDNSGSMARGVLGTGRTQQEIANDATALALRSLDPHDLVGVVVFNSDADLLLPLGPNNDSGRMSDTVRAIPSGGGTNMPPALRIAREEFQRAAGDIKTRHVVILSDGASRGRGDLPGLVARLAEDGVKVSAVGVGDGADLETLRLLADTGHGEFFHATNATQLPRLLLRAVRVVRTPLIREEPFTPVVTSPGSPLVQGLGELPSLGGLVLTRARPEPTITTALAAPDAPLLAHWQVGLGQVVAWTSDTGDWAADWIASPAYATLWDRVLRVTARAAAPQGLAGSAEVTGGEIVLRLDAADRAGLGVSARVYAPSGAGTDTTLAQVGPGLYEGRVRADETGSYIAVVKAREGSRDLPPLLVGATLRDGAETRSFESSEALLREIAAATGGRVLEFDAATPPALFVREGVPPREAVTRLTGPLLAWTLVVLLLDIATRRVAWDRWTSRVFRPELAETAPVAVTNTDALRRTRVAPDAPAIALGEAEARELVMAARDRRRAQRLGETTPAEGSAPPPESSGLLLAKRRALDQFKDEQP